MPNSGFWNDFISNGTATLLGAILGIPIALWISTFQSTIEQRARKTKILTLLEEEISENFALLKLWDQWPESFIVRSLNLLARIKVKHWNAFSDGGELQWIQNPDLLGQIADAYHNLIMLKELCDKLFLVLPMNAIEGSEGVISELKSLIESEIEKTISVSEGTMRAIDQAQQSLAKLNWYERIIYRGDKRN